MSCFIILFKNIFFGNMNTEKYQTILAELKPHNAKLIAVSKTKPVEDILLLYNEGQRIFGENKVQELTEKYNALPKDVEWHLIGHLQTNKVKYVAPFVSLIHSTDSLHLLEEINKQAQKCNRVIHCLLQIAISEEETKFGLSVEELYSLLGSKEFSAMKNVCICGLMGMATFTIDEAKINQEFSFLKKLFGHVKAKYFPSENNFKEISMGMSSDYKIALKNGATLVRIGSEIFGARKY